ncbi:MAG TPA: protein kinase, partial [Ktedonobacteraceae bacterium]|nr:protein kinase [Ktedonobacteraceae bacterium]
MPVLGEGQIFERYRIIKWLGNGSAGESYEAEDTMLLRRITLKLIHPWTTLPDSARRQFFREMQGVSTLNQRYLAPLLDYGEIDGRTYVARRYVSSGSLLGTNGRLWFHPPLSLEDAFKYSYQLAQALYYIHQRGYAHGSLTFSNVLVLRGANVENEKEYAPFLLSDVGLGSFVRRFGKPGIEALPVSAAPEQINKRVTAASDQFALAVLVYFWLAGRPPYLGTPEEVEQLKLSETITPLSKLNSAVTAEQDAIILRALAVQPEQRYPTVLAFAEALQTSLTSPAPSRPVPVADSPRPPETPRELLGSSPAFSRDAARTGALVGDVSSKDHESVPASISSPSEEQSVEPPPAPLAAESSQELSEVSTSLQTTTEPVELVDEAEAIEQHVEPFPVIVETPAPEVEIMARGDSTGLITQEEILGEEKIGPISLSSEAVSAETGQKSLTEQSEQTVAG